MYLELLKIPFEIQLMKILEKVPFALCCCIYLVGVFFLDWRVFCKSYSLTFVNLLLQKLAGSKFSHPWLMYISSKRHMNNYTKKVPLLNCITKKVLGHIFQYHSRFRKGQGCHTDWKYPKSLSELILINFRIEVSIWMLNMKMEWLI